MCLFRGMRGRLETGLLTKDTFPIPLPDEELGGDVVIGWRAWGLFWDGTLHSVHHSATWRPDKPIQAAGRYSEKGEVSTRSGIGIYCHGDKREARNEVGSCFGRVALFGKVLVFDRVKSNGPEGAMGEFAYPLDLYIKNRAAGTAQVAVDLWGPYGVHVYDGSITEVAKQLC